MQKKLFFLLCVICFISATTAQTADFYYCGSTIDYQTVGFWTTDNNSTYAAYQAVVYEVDIANTYTIAGPFTYTYTTYEGGAGGPGMGNMTQLRPDKNYRIYYQVKANITDPWSAPGTPCTFTTTNVEYLADCGAGALNIDANGVVASDYDGLYQYYRFEFSVDNTFSEHTVIGSPISNKFSIELDPTDKSPSNAPAYNTAPGLQYSHVYYARVRVRMDPTEPWSNAGPVCTFTTYCPGTSIPPVYYYQFENSQYDGAGTVCYSGQYANYADAMGTTRLMRTPSAITPQSGQVGTCRQEYLTNTYNSSYLFTCSGTCTNCALNCIWGCTDTNMDMTTTSALSIEFLLKPDNSKGNSWQFLTNFGSVSNPYIAISPGNFVFEITNPTNTTVTSYINTAFVPSYPGLFSENYFNDGNWHHLVCVYDGNASPPQMQMWVDAQLVPDLTTTVNVPSSITFPDSFTNGSNITAANYNGFWDELAVYNQALPPGMIYQHYKDMQAGNHYNLCTIYWRAVKVILTKGQAIKRPMPLKLEITFTRQE